MRKRRNTAYCGDDVSGVSIREADTPRSDPTLSFKVYNANGGRIVEFYSYDKYTDRSDQQLFIIRDDEDFGNAIKNIAVTYMLSK